MSKRKLLTAQEKIDIVAEYQSGKGSDTVAKIFKIHPNTVLKLLKKVGIKSRPILNKVTPAQEKIICDMYAAGRFIRHIRKVVNVGPSIIKKYIVKNGFSLRKEPDSLRNYLFNEHYFDVIDTQEKAYILGFIYADGCNLYEHDSISIHLHSKDVDILYKMRDLTYHMDISLDPVKVGIRVRKNRLDSNGNPKISQVCSFGFYSKHMCEVLKNLGCGPRKSLTCTFPEWLVDPDLIRHFIRGYYDGDGGLHMPKKPARAPKARIIGTNQFIDKLFSFIPKEVYRINTETINLFMIRKGVSGYKQVKIFLDWLYKDATIYLNRKYDLYKILLWRIKRNRKAHWKIPKEQMVKEIDEMFGSSIQNIYNK